ncbi:DNA-binding Xre family transcriptional regulator [Anaerobacterium chartisolvens]|uniref:DNA-binding Xre family transcriptional regulator n=1 Tax=Anaerobacterium chartisolvens TaxID=1297424 RepID=A0A369AZ76_9FIRM|nr:helix-turn-helix transcriptional regulator [Anaerobacterium chartisolvens]RCX12754.1 DNA-binding Xre family transcriptional regulator [Anaerobacterium chartisolvens]
MAFSYNKLWKLLIDKKINKVILRDAISITPTTLSRLGKDQNVSMDVLGRICKYLKCDIVDIVEYINEQEAEK